MALDTLIKKFFPVITGLLVAIIAYLQASGVVTLVADSVLGVQESDLVSGSLQPKKSSALTHRAKPKTAAAIIANNVFDHETDLKPKPPEPKVEEETPKVTGLDVSDPLNAARCSGVVVQIVTESTDPTWSIAVIKEDKAEKGVVRRVGDSIADMEVQYIGFNRLRRSPAVWMSQGSKLCQSLLFPEEEPPEAITPGETPGEKEPAAEPRPVAGGASEVSKEIADKIEKLSDTEFNVDRAVVDNILENQATLMRSARIVPEKGADGKTVGIRLFGVRPQTLLGTLGLQNGDRLETINGFEMASPEKALEAYARLRTANKLTIKVTRRGKPMNIDFNIK